MRNFFYSICCFLICSAAALSQTPPPIPPECGIMLDDIRNKPASERASNVQTSLDLGQNSACYARLLIQGGTVAKQGFADFIKKLESLRTDKQAGSSSGTGGTTNLASKGTTAQVLSVAAESGALTESVNKQVVTVSGSLDGIPSVLVRKSVIPYCPEGASRNPDCIHQDVFDALRRLSFGVSFDTSTNNQTVNATASGQPSGTAQPVTFTASSREVTAWNARFILWNARDATSKAFTTRWQQLVTQANSAGTSSNASAAGNGAGASGNANTNPSPAAAIQAGKALLQPLENLINASQISKTDYDNWYNQAYSALMSVNLQQPGLLESTWTQYVQQLLEMIVAKNPSVADTASAYVRAVSQYEFEERQFVEEIANKPVLTLEYDDNRPIGQSSTSTARLIFDKGIGKTWSLTFNGGVTLYNSTLPSDIPGVSRLRDTQFAAQAQKDLGTLKLLGATALAGTYYFQYQNSPAVLNVTPGTPLPGITLTGLPSTASEVFAEKGNLHIVQLRLLLGPGSSSVRFPLAVSYSNRTELIAKPTWRAQFGISYDFDSLFAK